jgi:arylsulfatase A-like enzyme
MGHRTIGHPNIIFVLSDQHRYASLPWTGVGQVQAPTLARLREQGVSFSRAYSNYPVCSPARAMIMSGKWAQEVGFPHNGFELDPTPDSLGERFARAGYQTSYIGKWHLHAGPDAGDQHCRYIPPGEGRHGFQRMTIWTETNKHCDAAYYDDPGGERISYVGYNAIGMTDQALGFLREAAGVGPGGTGAGSDAGGRSGRSKDPFFLWLNYNPPHPPLDDAPVAALAAYDERSVEFLPNVPSRLAGGEELVPVGAHRSHKTMTLADQIRQYQAHITAVDQQLGRIVGFLEESGLAPDTVLIYTSDHGDMLGSHGLIRKSYFYAESAQVPFLVWGPGRVPGGVETDALFSTIDYYPTLLGLAGIEPAPTARGINHADAIASAGTSSRHDELRTAIPHFATGRDDPAFQHGSRGLRTDRHLYIRSESGVEEVYDYISDPYEDANMAADHSELVRRLREQTRDAMPQAPAVASESPQRKEP